MKFSIPAYVKRVLNKLEEYNYQAFIVGGSVRDSILGERPCDYDVTTNAKPDEIEEVFKDHKTILVGKEFGTVAVVQEEGNIEITSYRREGGYLDGRRPSQVIFSDEIGEDLSRRDFTINAMAYNESTGLIDLFNGREDLEARKIRTVGNPKERFNEDHLRILRAVRFAAQLNFTMEEDTEKACRQMGHLLEKISAERSREELFKILLSQKPSHGIRLMKDLGLLNIIIPELMDAVGFNQYNPHHDKDVFEHTLCVVDNAPKILEVRLAALFHDIGKPHTLTMDEKGIGHFYGHDKVGAHMAKGILRRLKSSNEIIHGVTSLIREHMAHHNEYKEKGLKRLINRVGQDKIFNLIELQKADRICSSKDVDISFLVEREEQIRLILKNHEPYEKKQLAINGYDIINLGYPQGKLIGDILDYLMERVMDEAGLNTKDKLIELTLKKYEK